MEAVEGVQLEAEVVAKGISTLEQVPAQDDIEVKYDHKAKLAEHRWSQTAVLGRATRPRRVTVCDRGVGEQEERVVPYEAD